MSIQYVVPSLHNSIFCSWYNIHYGPGDYEQVSKKSSLPEAEMARAKKKPVDTKVEDITKTLARLSLEGQTNPVQVQTVAPSSPPKRRAPRKKPTPSVLSPSVLSPLAPAPLAYESTEIPLTHIEVMKIQVKRFVVGDKQYFLDPKKYKVYQSISDTCPGPYVGRWDPHEEVLNTSFPDSDEE
jgi:hypothetical protein